MTKKLIALATISIFLLGLASCTVAGAELGLMGKWKGTNSGADFVFEFKNDDTYTMTMTMTFNGMSMVNEESGTIVKADSAKKTITLKDDKGTESTYTYDLTGKKLKLTTENGSTLELEKQ